MRAAVTAAPGGPIHLDEIPDPEPRSGEVLVRVGAVAVTDVDVSVFAGAEDGATFPLVQGNAVAGTVERGSGSLPTGTRVVVKAEIACARCRWCRAGRQSRCLETQAFGVDRPGGFAELVAVPRPSAFALPKGLSFADGAASHAHARGLRMIRSAGPMPRDSFVVVTGAEGPLGTAVLEIASALELRTVGIVRSSRGGLAASAAGASDTIDSGAGPVGEAIAPLTDGRGADLVIETTGREAAALLPSVADGGSIVTVAGADRIDIGTSDLARGRITIAGSSGSDAADLRDALRMLEERGIHPTVPRRYALDDAASAVAAAADPGRVGAVVVVLGRPNTNNALQSVEDSS
jgi:D-arabinose 1-dehydrogenase-like Zn-dependent alcohol dehydrogenase